MNEIKILITRVGGDSAAPLPAYQTAGSSGMDLACYLESPVWLEPQSTLLVSTGISLGLPEGYEAQIRPRSGLALKHGITLLNAPGTIDSDYRGIISVILINHGKDSFQLTPGMRIAQLVIQKVVRAVLEETDTLDRTVRAAGGFGHTGV